MFNDLFLWKAQGIPRENKYFIVSVEPAVSLLVWKYTCYLKLTKAVLEEQSE